MHYLKILPIIILIISGCRNDHKKTYAIRDFDKSLQPYLIEIVSKNVVIQWDSATKYIEKHVSDKELIDLSQSELPILRAYAINAMLKRDTSNNYNIIMKNLDDTAVVAVDHGEWGIKFDMVSDLILDNGIWKNVTERNKTIDEVIINHNKLHSAYAQLRYRKIKPTYYASIKEMVQQKRVENLAYRGFEDIEGALYAFASFNKPEDAQLIKQILLENLWQLGELSFQLIKDFPNETYTDLCEEYYKEYFFWVACDNRRRSDNHAPDFISAVAALKNERSARILSSILNRKPFEACPPDEDPYSTIVREVSYSKIDLAYQIWNNKCDAYSQLRKQVEHIIKKEEDEKKKKKILIVKSSGPLPEPEGPTTWWR